ncbi:MAG TPA: type II CAAX endopeptidase family protein [Dermatophilaceae bacterium]|jgi:membrane protease YdiL (CAAX protease family)|nr:type II CAAX endopeptidase family protein [Dermatophilaceae bacterium]HMT89959.1 type II CAAX endopeptidase family protein [Dermatophilaceae bacterium]
MVSRKARPRTPGLHPVIARYDRPGRFYLLATVIPWGLWLAAGYLSRQSDQGATAVAVLGLLGLLTPMGVAWVMVHRDPVLVRDVRRRLLSVHRVRPGFALLAVGLLPVSLIAATAVSLLLGYPPEQFLWRGGPSFVGGLVPGWVALTLAPIVEELAWHSYGTDALASRWTIWRSSMVFGVIWAFWHLPLATIQGYYQSEVVEAGVLAMVTFLGSVFPFVILMNWIYYRSGRSILVAVLFHLAANLGNEALRTHPDTKAIQAALLVFLTVIVVWWDRDLFFGRPGCPPLPDEPSPWAR